MLSADVAVDRREFAVAAELAVAPGERLALFGPSGAGKTTLLEVIAGLVAPARGRVELNGRLLTSAGPPARAVPPWQRRIGLLRQDPALFPHLPVRGNLGYALPRHRGGTGQAGQAGQAELTGLAGRLGLDGLLAEMPARLSGGQAHRVALGRLLLAPCEALLLDEPFTGLDAGLRRSLTELVAALVADRQVPAILVAHELADAQAFGDRLAILDRGELLQCGPPGQVVRRPASRRVAELAGYLGFVPAPAGDATGAVAGVHPDRVVPGAHPERGVVLAGLVTGRRPAGARWEADLTVPVPAGPAAGPAAGPVTGTAASREVTVVCRLDDRPGDGPLTVTAVDPPRFGPDGTARPARTAEPGLAPPGTVQA